eukprot:163538_1
MKHSSILNWLVLLIIVSNSHRLIDAELSSSSDISDSSSYECVVNADCDDGIFCNGQETCDKNNGCQLGTDPCDDKIACTVDSCIESTDSCDNTPNDAFCDDNLFCTGTQKCFTDRGCGQSGKKPCPESTTCDESNETCII